MIERQNWWAMKTKKNIYINDLFEWKNMIDILEAELT